MLWCNVNGYFRVLRRFQNLGRLQGRLETITLRNQTSFLLKLNDQES
jgi:hypothetical protein